MSDVSNKTIVGLLAVALVITVVGTVVSVSKLSDLGGNSFDVTGAATTGSGTTTLNLDYIVSVAMNGSTANFGHGYINPGNKSARIYTRNNSHAGSYDQTTNHNWTINASSTANQMQIINTGNVDVNLVATQNLFDGEEWLCGSEGGCSQTANVARLLVNATEHEDNSCDGGLAHFTNTSHLGTTLLNNTNSTVRICTDFDWEDSSDSLNVTFAAHVPFDATQGSHAVTLTFTASSRGEQ